MELTVWQSDFGLPSVEADCLQFLAFLKMCPVQVEVRDACTPWKSLNGSYPIFQDGDAVFTEFCAFSEHLKRKAHRLAIDTQSEDSRKGELLSYRALLDDRLRPAYMYAVWVDNPNFNTVTSRWYNRNVVFPYNLWYTGKRRRSAMEYLKLLYPGSLVTEQDIEYATTRHALTCFNMLSAKLGDKKYFYGDRPTSLDALVFGYLAPLLKLPLPNDRLQQHLKSCPNLVRFVESIISIYLPLTDEEMKKQKRDMEEWERRKSEAQAEIRKSRQETAKEEDSENSDEFKIRDKILFAIGAVALSILAAVHFGIIKVELRKVDVNDSRTPDLPEDVDVDLLFDYD